MGVAGHVVVERDLAAWTDAAVERFVAAGRSAVEERGRFVVALAGGRTPQGLYEALAGPRGDSHDWGATTFVLGDERCLPAGDPGRNLTMATEALLAPRAIDPTRVLSLYDGSEPRSSVDAAVASLEVLLGGRGTDGPPATPIDLVLLGIGDNCHTASLFPGLPWSLDHQSWVVANYVEVVGQWRLTLTPLVLGDAREVLFLITGAAKAAAVASVLEGPVDPVVRPAQAFLDVAQATWLLDRPAAAALAS